LYNENNAAYLPLLMEPQANSSLSFSSLLFVCLFVIPLICLQCFPFVEKNQSDIILCILRVQEHGGEPIIPFSCALERNLADMPENEAAKYCEENNVQRLVQN
jgi:hypothetical protein